MSRSYCAPLKITAKIPRILSEKGMRHGTVERDTFAFRHFYIKTITRSFGANRKLHAPCVIWKYRLRKSRLVVAYVMTSTKPSSPSERAGDSTASLVL